MSRFVLFVIACGIIFWVLQRYKKSSAAMRKQMMGRLWLYGSLVVILALVMTGRVSWFFGLIGLAIPWFERAMLLKRVYQMYANVKPSTPLYPVPKAFERCPRFIGKAIDVFVNLDQKSIDGVIKSGSFEKQLLSELSVDDLMSFASSLKKDSEDYAIFDAYMKKAHESQWVEHAMTDSPDDSRLLTMNAEDAMRILGVDNSSDSQEVNTAYKRLMQNLHPDRGGSAYLTAYVNQAKTILIAKS